MAFLFYFCMARSFFFFFLRTYIKSKYQLYLLHLKISNAQILLAHLQGQPPEKRVSQCEVKNITINLVTLQVYLLVSKIATSLSSPVSQSVCVWVFTINPTGWLAGWLESGICICICICKLSMCLIPTGNEPKSSSPLPWFGWFVLHAGKKKRIAKKMAQRERSSSTRWR